MTGATGVHLLLWDDDRQDWLLPAPDARRHRPGQRHRPANARCRCRCCATSSGRVNRWSSATPPADDRFARDPYFADVDCCSLLAVPILSRGALRAVLLLENRLIRAAFTTGRLDAVNLIAGQLAVSLDNAQLYAEYRRIAGEQAALRRVATLVARAAPPQEVFAAVAEEVGRLLAADFAILVRYDPPDTLEVAGTWTSTGAPAPTPVGGRLPLGGRNVTTLVHQTGQPARIDYDDAVSGAIGQVATGDWGLRSSVGVPVSVEGRLWGAMVVAFTRPELLPGDTEARLAGFTELVATAIANAGAQAEVTASRARIVAAADQARRRIERDLHDGAQQRLVTLALQLRAAQAGGAARARRAGRGTRAHRRRAGRRAGRAARDRARHPPRRSWPTAASARRSGARPPLPGPGGPPGTRRRTAARAGRGQRLLRRRRGADQRGQARPRLGRHRRGRGRR